MSKRSKKGNKLIFWTCQCEGEKAHYLSFQCNLMQRVFFPVLFLLKACHTPMKTHKPWMSLSFPGIILKLLLAVFETVVLFLKGCTDLLNTNPFQCILTLTNVCRWIYTGCTVKHRPTMGNDLSPSPLSAKVIRPWWSGLVALTPKLQSPY